MQVILKGNVSNPKFNKTVVINNLKAAGNGYVSGGFCI